MLAWGTAKAPGRSPRLRGPPASAARAQVVCPARDRAQAPGGGDGGAGGDPLPQPDARHAGPGGDDGAGRLVADDHRWVDLDAAVLDVQVGAADAGGGDATMTSPGPATGSAMSRSSRLPGPVATFISARIARGCPRLWLPVSGHYDSRGRRGGAGGPRGGSPGPVVLHGGATVRREEQAGGSAGRHHLELAATGGRDALRLAPGIPRLRRRPTVRRTSSAGQRLDALLPQLTGHAWASWWCSASTPRIRPARPALRLSADRQSREPLAEVPARVQVVDVGGDHRFVEGWTYGLPSCPGAREIAAPPAAAIPGCYSVPALLTLAPLVAGLIEPEGIVIDAKSGVSGAGPRGGRDLRLRRHQRGPGAVPPAAATHHVPEIQEALSRLAEGRTRSGLAGAGPEPGGGRATIAFSPHLVPMTRRASWPPATGARRGALTTGRRAGDGARLLRRRAVRAGGGDGRAGSGPAHHVGHGLELGLRLLRGEPGTGPRRRPGRRRQSGQGRRRPGGAERQPDDRAARDRRLDGLPLSP